MKTGLIIAAVVLIVGGAFGNYMRYIEQIPDRPAQFQSVPMETDGYVGAEHRFADLSYEVLQADTTTLRQYTGPDGTRFWLFVAYFSSQKYGSQIHSPIHCLPGGGWRIRRHEAFELPLADGRIKQINRVIISEGNRNQLMFYWFETRGGAIRKEFGLKLDLMRNSLLLRPTDAAFVRLTLPVAPGESIEAASQKAVAFLRTFHPYIEAALPFGGR